MFYGDGGAGKTTLTVDLACHLAAGDAWLGMDIARESRVLLIENEGPRALFRAKLRRKHENWPGSPLDDRLRVLEEPWAQVGFADAAGREALAEIVRDQEIDVVIVGPITAAGMNAAGTLQEVREFAGHVQLVGVLAGRLVTFVLVHHDSKAGEVSGAWEGVGDTLIKVSQQGNGYTVLRVQKARWSSKHHGTTMHLAWADGEGFEVIDKPEVSDEHIEEAILEAVTMNPGINAGDLDKAVTGRGERKHGVRDRFLREGRIVNVKKGELLDTVPPRTVASLYLASDPGVANLRPGRDGDGTQSASARAAQDQMRLRPASPLTGDAGADADDSPPYESMYGPGSPA